jgi:hypothetical protein
MKEWLRCIKLMGYLILILPNMINNDNYEGVAKFKCTEKFILSCIKFLPAKLIDINLPKISTSFGVVIQRLPQDRDNYLMAYTPFGPAIRISETENKIMVIYPDKTEREFLKTEIKISGNCRHIDYLEVL